MLTAAGGIVGAPRYEVKDQELLHMTAPTKHFPSSYAVRDTKVFYSILGRESCLESTKDTLVVGVGLAKLLQRTEQFLTILKSGIDLSRVMSQTWVYYSIRTTQTDNPSSDRLVWCDRIPTSL